MLGTLNCDHAWGVCPQAPIAVDMFDQDGVTTTVTTIALHSDDDLCVVFAPGAGFLTCHGQADNHTTFQCFIWCLLVFCDARLPKPSDMQSVSSEHTSRPQRSEEGRVSASKSHA